MRMARKNGNWPNLDTLEAEVRRAYSRLNAEGWTYEDLAYNTGIGYSTIALWLGNDRPLRSLKTLKAAIEAYPRFLEVGDSGYEG